MSQLRRNLPEPESAPVNAFKFEPSRRQVLAIGGAGLGAWFLAGCSNGSSPSPSSASSSGTPKKGGTLRVSFSDASADDGLDPAHLFTTSAYVAANCVYDQLATLNLTDFTAVPQLAKSWDVNSEGTEWTIHLQTGVKWHDGSTFSSKDVVYTMSRWFDPKVGNPVGTNLAGYLDMKGVSAPDASTVVLKLTKPNGALMQLLANQPNSAITKDGVTDFTPMKAVGTGPFKVSEWSPGNGWKVTRNDAYWGGAPYLDGVDAKTTPDQSAKIQAALASSTDLTDVIPTSLWTSLQKRSNVKLEVIKSHQAWVFAFDQTQAPFNDARVISALKLATDRDKIVATALSGQGATVADIPIDPHNSTWYPSNVTPEHSAEKAKALLADAGFAKGLNITLSTSSAIPGMVDVAQAWQQVVKDAGINVTLNQLGADTYYTKGWMASPAFMDYWSNSFPPIWLNAIYRTGAAYPYTHFTDPDVDKLTEEALASSDLATQVHATQQAYSAARETMGFVIPAFADAAYAQSPKVNGIIRNIGLFDFRKTWLA